MKGLVVETHGEKVGCFQAFGIKQEEPLNFIDAVSF